jgi:V8-like Glu-specific endopeptidase
LVLTAAHCVIDAKTHAVYKDAMYFYANMINGATNIQARVTYVWYGTNTPDNKRERDWALLRLDKRLGDTQGWFGTRQIPLATMKVTNGILVGYSDDYRNGQTAGIHTNCKIMSESRANMFLHDCDSTRGSSGGPIFAYWNNQPSIYALNVADLRNNGDISLKLPQFTDKNGNIAIWSSELQNKILELNRS